MSVIPAYVVSLVCDGCGKKLRDGEQFDNSATAHGVAFADGWRFVPKITAKTGRESNRSPHDVCPDCLPTFEPKVDQPRRLRGAA